MCLPDQMKSSECLSPAELERKFFGEQSFPSTTSLEQLSASMVSTGPAVEGPDSRLSFQVSRHLSSDSSSPYRCFLLSSLNPQETDSGHLAVPLQGKSSTPQGLLHKPQKAARLQQPCAELSVSQISWDVSVIKSENSPRLPMEIGTMEQTWSPKVPQHVPGEVSP